MGIPTLHLRRGPAGTLPQKTEASIDVVSQLNATPRTLSASRLSTSALTLSASQALFASYNFNQHPVDLATHSVTKRLSLHRIDLWLSFSTDSHIWVLLLPDTMLDITAIETKPRTYPTATFPLAQLPGSLPTLKQALPQTLDPVPIIDYALKTKLSSQHLAADALYRDLYALTGTLRTFYTPEKIIPVWSELAAAKKARNFQLVKGSTRLMNFMPGGPTCGWIQGRFEFDLEVAPGVKRAV